MLKPITHTITLNDGRTITLETGKLARQADGAVVVRMNNTMLLATVVSAKEAKEGVDFMPLTVDYQEKFAASGRIPGSFFKREGKLSDYEILVSRLVDRALRPLFPEDYHADTQVLIYLISSDKKDMPDALAGLAASAAIAVSDIPVTKMMSEVRVGKVDGKFIINPDIDTLEKSTIDMMVAGTETDIIMVEGEMNEISEDEMVEAIQFAHQAIKQQIIALKEFAQKANAPAKRTYSHETNDEEFKKKMYADLFDKVYQCAKSKNPNKHERNKAFADILEEYKKQFSAEDLEKYASLFDKYYGLIQYDAVRKMILEEKIRLDGRGLTDIRPIYCEVNYLPMAHGSAIFTRGETQSLTTVTLGTPDDILILDKAMKVEEEKFILHYNFPPFSTGEVKPMRGPGRREVGHGNLAHRALKRMVPQDTGYTIRVVSDILESNGSSSMATVCAGTLALMDAGIKIKKPVAGIAMGLITDDKGNYAVLSDILGDEDHLGDMDFKVCGTKDGITAVQMDLKVNGLSFDIMKKALYQAREGRMHIMNEMLKAISEPRSDYKPHAPRYVSIDVPVESFGAIIGTGGKVIQEIQRETQTTIQLEETGGIMGRANIFGNNIESVNAAVNRIKLITAIPEVGEVYTAKVKTIMPYGAFVEFLPGKDALLHISEYDWVRRETLADVLKEGDTVEVKYLGIDQKTGKYKVSRKVLLAKPN
ncbi:MAG TPA: polyribonucleotide nucleotidyltransferase [Bacteroidia bacterium]|mgnify:CR=1 FL=1|nr:polyribonucleotide nucleotidyltransferase [Bacteroidia bacterium]